MSTKRLCFLLTCLFTANLYAADLMTSDPERWFRDAYAPLWNDAPGDKITEILAYYATEVESHAHNGTVFRANKEEWLTGPMEEWLAEGWAPVAAMDSPREEIDFQYAGTAAALIDALESRGWRPPAPRWTAKTFPACFRPAARSPPDSRRPRPAGSGSLPWP